jgi:hypothetical protein
MQFPYFDVLCSSQVIQAWYVMGRLGAEDEEQCIMHYCI